MASAVRFVVEKLAEIGGGLAIQRLKEEALQIEEIQLELESMGSFLKDADRRKRRKISNDGDGMRTFEGQVREVAYKVEDIIDKYMYHIAEQDTGEGLLESVMLKAQLLRYKRQIASELKAVKFEIQEISKRYKRYDLRERGSTSNTNDDDGSSGGENRQRLRQHARLIPDVEIVGIEEDKKFLIKRLIESDQVPKRVVLSVVGMGGLGKTTIVTKVYDSPEVEKHFDCRAWITVSQTYKVDELLRNLMKGLCKSTNEPIPNGVDEMDYIEISELLISYLQKKRYVIVLDDVWKAIVWQHIQLALPDNGCGSRVIITTRMDDFASSFGVENVLHLRHLGYDDAFVLFCSKAFSNKSCPPHLKSYAESLVKKCEGLPLAIVNIGGLMSMKENSSLEWRLVADNLSWQLGNNKDLGGLRNILLLSFNDLPYNLKYCFLYCSIFPEDCLITQERVIRLWVAQGFIQERRGQTLEEVAADYIKDLVRRGMLQHVEKLPTIEKKLRMHDVLRELAISIGHEENFCYISDGKEEALNKKARYLSIGNRVVNIRPSNCHLRSLMLFKIEITSLSLRGILSSFKLLRVLDLEDSPIESMPDELVELFNLRYLSLRNTNVEELPESIGRLQNLQSLDTSKSKINILPKGVEKLKKLRHIYTCRNDLTVFPSNFDVHNFAQAPDGICNLKCLQTLEVIGASNEMVKKIGNLTQLRKLLITKVGRDHGVELCASLQKMERLRFLAVATASEEEFLNMEALSSPPTHLEILALYGRLERVPLWIASLQNLTIVALRSSKLNEDPLSSLQALPNLMTLILEKAYVGKELYFRSGHFLQLKVLCIGGYSELNQVKFEEESMSCIQTLHFFWCPNLKNVEGIQYLTSLQHLFLKEVSGALKGKIQGDEWVNFQHIPRLRNFNSTKGVYERLHQIFHTQVPSGVQGYHGRTEEREVTTPLPVSMKLRRSERLRRAERLSRA
ncbi:hypothetical protein AAC387_Pa08g0965 [Persea americana]